MRLLIFHGYLLGGTGSNVYNAQLVEALVRLGHEVHVLCQERHPEEHPFLAEAGDWDEGSLRMRRLPGGDAGPGRATSYRPDIHGLLPVYVADRYEGVEAKPFPELTPDELDRYVEANVAAVREVVALAEPELALANHLVMGPVIVRRALAGRIPYAVKVHGSALEYTVKKHRRFLGPAREGLERARGVLVGSHHTAASLWAALGEPDLPARTRLGPPGVDVVRFAPRAPEESAAGVRRLAARLRAEPPARASEGSAFARDPAQAAAAVEQLAAGDGPLVAYVGKLIVSKGVDLLLAAWPLVLEHVPEARLAVVGFGGYRDGLTALARALAQDDVHAAREIALAGRSLEEDGAEAKPLGHLLAFLDGLRGDDAERYRAAAAGIEQSVVFTGRLEHDELADLLPACAALVAPSTFPEAFGMVAAEGAACGAVPVVARHSGLQEVSEVLAAAVPAEAAIWLSFALDDGAVRALAGCLTGALSADADLLERARSGLVKTVRERWSWERVAAGVIAAARGELAGLEQP